MRNVQVGFVSSNAFTRWRHSCGSCLVLCLVCHECMYVSNTIRAEMLVSIDFINQKYIRKGDLNGVGCL